MDDREVKGGKRPKGGESKDWDTKGNGETIRERETEKESRKRDMAESKNILSVCRLLETTFLRLHSFKLLTSYNKWYSVSCIYLYIPTALSWPYCTDYSNLNYNFKKIQLWHPRKKEKKK